MSMPNHLVLKHTSGITNLAQNDFRGPSTLSCEKDRKASEVTRVSLNQNPIVNGMGRIEVGSHLTSAIRSTYYDYAHFSVGWGNRAEAYQCEVSTSA